MPAPPISPEIFINLTWPKKLGAMRIWNYNKSMIESTKGIKELEIVNHGVVIWSNELTRAPGNPYEQYCNEIILISGTKLPAIQT